jgi:hypothetical protein
MELRNHPFMRRHGIANWPPVWTQAKKENNKAMRGEFGVLRYVHWNNHAGSNKCYLVMDHNTTSVRLFLMMRHFAGRSPLYCKRTSARRSAT